MFKIRQIIGRKWRKIVKYGVLLGLLSGVLWILHSKFGRLANSVLNESAIPIIIVEEHHEVLPYWLNAVDSGILPARNVTIFHIDGHSDEAAPEYGREMPFFHWPKNETEEKAMLQKNDMFIQMAAMIGLMGRFIWMFPNWLNIEKSNETVELGYFYHQSSEKDTKPQPYFCECRSPNDAKEDVYCTYVNYTEDAPVEIKMKQSCNIKTSYISETVGENEVDGTAHNVINYKEDQVLTLLKIKKDEPVIWNIDMDYFGCEIPGEHLIKAMLTWRVVELIDQKLINLFCPSRFPDEDKADSIMKNLINIFIEQCEFNHINIKCKQPFEVLRELTEAKLSQQWMGAPGVFCARNDHQLRNSWKDIAFIFHHLTLMQFEALKYLGFCFNFSPKTFGAEEAMAIRICHGLNPPGSEMIETYSPTFQDILYRAFRLKDILKQLPPPKFVTICRSARDGYVPRKDRKYIEELVLNAVKGSHESEAFKVQYDEDLLGGEKGRDWST